MKPTSESLNETAPPQKASYARRLAAAGYDGFLLFAVLFAATALYAWLHGMIVPVETVQFETGAVTHELEPIAQGWLFNLYLLAVIICFYAGFWCKNGQTLGMQAWRLKLQDQNGNVVSFATAAIRVVVAIASIGPIGMLSIFFTPQRQAVCDLLSKTYVVLLPKPVKK